MCTLYVLFYLSDTNTPHRQYWLQLPLRIARCPSRANGGAPVPAPMVALPFRRLLTFARPTPVPPSPHQVHLSHLSLVCSNQPANGGAPVLSLPFRRVLTTVHPSPTNAPSSPSFPSFPSVPSLQKLCVLIQPLLSNQIQPIQSSQSSRYDPDPAISSDPGIQRYNPADTTDTIQPANTKSSQPMRSGFF